MCALAAWSGVLVGVLPASVSAAATSSPTVSVGDGSIVVKAGKLRTLYLAVTLSQPATAPMTVQYQLAADTAAAGNCTKTTPAGDFNNVGGALRTLSFLPGVGGVSAIVKYVAVRVCPHAGLSQDVAFTLTLTNPTGGYALGKAVGVASILSDRWPNALLPVASVGDKSISDGSTGLRNLVFDVTLSSPAAAAVWVKYKVVSWTATCGPAKAGRAIYAGNVCNNLNGATLNLWFPAGYVQREIAIPVFGGTPFAADESFAVQLVGVTGPAALGRSLGVGTIIADYTPMLFASLPATLATSWPDASDTGVPAGTVLTAYTGPTTITSCGTVIDSQVISGGLQIRVGNGYHDADHPCVTITNSIITGAITTHYSEWSCPLSNGSRGVCGPLVMRDSEIAMPIPNAGDAYALGQTNYFVWRINEHGGRTAMDCDGWCEIHDSYLHDNYYVAPQHMGSFHSSGASGRPVWLDHTTLLCNVANLADYHGNGGCSADVMVGGDFSPIQNMTFTNNLFLANPGLQWYSMYTGVYQRGKPFPMGSNITFFGNVWQRCATAPAFGGCLPVSTTTSGDGVVPDWDIAVAATHGDRWCNNRFDDGTLVAQMFETNNC